MIGKKSYGNTAVVFVLLESEGVKAARKMLVKLTPGLNFIKLLGAYLGA